MRYHAFGKDQILVSEIGLGTWQLGSDWGKVDDEAAQAILAEAVARGITFFDTADVYGPEVSETRIGRFLTTCNENIFVATKLGRYPKPGWPKNFSLETFRTHTEASLRRLGLETLDLIQLHCIPTDILMGGEVFEWLRVLKKEGKIQHFGVSVETMHEALFCLKQEGVYSLQIIFNIFRQKPITSLFHQAKDRDIALVVRLPLASGLLTGKFTTATRFPEDDHRNYNRDGQVFNVGETFAGIPFERGVMLTEKLKPLVPQGMTMAQMALRWILDFDAVGVVIPGATSTRQVRENANVSGIKPLSEDLHQRLRSFYETNVAEYIRGPY